VGAAVCCQPRPEVDEQPHGEDHDEGYAAEDVEKAQVVDLRVFHHLKKRFIGYDTTEQCESKTLLMCARN